ncbi:MAG: OsmC family protein [SAR324 cluster bacterium]|nr:OsmC family protein [SAR324 cluster bacterium]
MNAEQLRELQAPFKTRYREDPQAAHIILKAHGKLGDDNLTCKIETGKGMVEAGLHPATGGTGMQACSGDMLLEALVACAGVTLKAVATAIGVELRGGTVSAECLIDMSGTLGVKKEALVGLQDIKLRFDLDTDADSEQLKTLQKLTERYCVIFQTLQTPPRIEVTLNTHPNGGG